MIAYSFKTFNILNIDKCIIEKTIEKTIEKIILQKISCLLKLKESNTIICGINKVFLLYDMNTDFYRTTRLIHKENIYDLLLIDEHTFVFCSRDKTIKVWKLLIEY